MDAERTNMLRQRPQRTKKPRAATSSSAKEDSTSSPPPPTLSKSGIITTGGMDGSDGARQQLLGAAKLAKDRDTSSLSERPSSPPSSTSSPHDVPEEVNMELQKMSKKSQWIVLAIASGACAAFNGVFAKLTTTELTTSFATSIANLVGLGSGEKAVEFVIRAIFFALNLIFNGVMWTLFTKALARGTSTTQVSIINTSSNFMITAILGFFIFTESLPPLWWLGAAMLVAGNVIIGRRGEDDPDKSMVGRDGIEEAESGEGRYSSEEEGLLVGEAVELNDDLELERKRKEDEEDILQLELVDGMQTGR